MDQALYVQSRRIFNRHHELSKKITAFPYPPKQYHYSRYRYNGDVSSTVICSFEASEHEILRGIHL